MVCATGSHKAEPVRVLVFLGSAADTRIPPVHDPRSGRVREEWLVREVDPASTRALDLALRLKKSAGAIEVTVVHFGPEDGTPWLRRALALGADRAVRVWDGEVTRARVAGKAVILAAAAEAAGFDLVLVGARGAVDADGLLGVWVAALLEVPCVTQVISIAGGETAANGLEHVLSEEGRVEMTRGLDRGFRERVEVPLPVVVTVSSEGFGALSTDGGVVMPLIPTAGSLIAAHSREIIVWDLADLGVPLERVRHADGFFVPRRPRPVRPRPRPIAAPDSALPAFDRILKLIEGSVKRREGRVVHKSSEETVAEIFQVLRDEGWLDHLRPQPHPPLDDADGLASGGDQAASDSGGLH